MESLFVVTSVVGVVEFLRRLQARDYFDAMTILASAVIGLIAGALGIDGLSVTGGLVAGLGATGLVTVASKVGPTSGTQGPTNLKGVR